MPPHNFSKDRCLIGDKPIGIGLLNEFEQWLQEEIKFNQYDNLGIALKMAKNKLETLKAKYKVG